MHMYIYGSPEKTRYNFEYLNVYRAAGKILKLAVISMTGGLV